MSYQENKNFSRREWLLTICILLMVEYWIFNAAYSFSSDQNVLNYISFAGTIASILLAVIAIIFGFYQNDSQQKANGALGVQVDNIRNAADDLTSAREQLARQLDRVSIVADKLDEVDTGVKDIRGMVSSLDATQQSIVNAISKKEVVDIEEPRGAATPEVARFILRETSTDADLLIHTLYRLNLIHGPNVPIPWSDIGEKHFADPLTEKIEKNTSRYLRRMSHFAIANQIMLTLRVFGFVRSGEIGEEINYILSPKLSDLLPALEAEVQGLSYQRAKDGVALIDASFVQKG